MSEERKKIVIVVSYFPIGLNETGGQKGATELIEYYLTSSKEVILLAPWVCEQIHGRLLKFSKILAVSKAHHFFSFLFSTLPFSSSKYYSRKNLALAKGIIDEHDAEIIIDHIGSSWCLEILRTMPKRAITYSAHNDEYFQRRSYLKGRLRFTSLGHLYDLLKIKRQEACIVNLSNKIISVTNEDIDTLSSRYDLSGKTIKIGLHFAQPAFKGLPYDFCGRNGVVAFGALKTPLKKDNLLKFLEVWKDKGESFEITIAGTMDRNLMKGLARISPKLHVVGYVDTPRTFLQGFRLGLIFEELGSGFNVRLIDYLEANTPVLLLENSIRGVAPSDGSIGLSFDSVAKMINEVPILLEDGDLLSRLALKQQHSKLWLND